MRVFLIISAPYPYQIHISYLFLLSNQCIIHAKYYYIKLNNYLVLLYTNQNSFLYCHFLNTVSLIKMS